MPPLKILLWLLSHTGNQQIVQSIKNHNESFVSRLTPSARRHKNMSFAILAEPTSAPRIPESFADRPRQPFPGPRLQPGRLAPRLSDPVAAPTRGLRHQRLPREVENPAVVPSRQRRRLRGESRRLPGVSQQEKAERSAESKSDEHSPAEGGGEAAPEPAAAASLQQDLPEALPHRGEFTGAKSIPVFPKTVH
jgi:hypothetical protein